MELPRGIALLALLVAAASAKSIASYDQRQEGKVNVQIDVKDVSIVALVDSDMLEDYASYDYAYDYADFTIKPSSRPTTSAKPSAVEEASPSSTEKAPSASSTAANSTVDEVSAANAQSTAASATTGADDAAATTDSKIIEIVINPTKAATEASSTASSAAAPSSTRRPAGIAEPRKKCPVGFLLKSGRCFKRRLSMISPRIVMMKLAPTLLSRAKVLARNLVNEAS